MRENHPEGTEAARKVWEQVSDAREALHQLQLAYPNVIDYRITQAEAALREADNLTRELAEGTTKELDAVRAQIANDPTHPMHPEYGKPTSVAYVGQIKTPNRGKWQSFRTATTPREAGETLFDVMQSHGLRYGELQGHITDMVNGDTLTAEDGTEFRVVEI